MDLGIADRVAIVTGSSRGIGRACAESLLKEGASVVVTGRDQASLDRCSGELAKSGEGLSTFISQVVKDGYERE